MAIIREFGNIGEVQYFITEVNYRNPILPSHFDAYIIVPNKVDYVDCHCGITYGDDEPEYTLPFLENMECENGYRVLGWDYGHAGDEGWTFEDVRKDVRASVQEVVTEYELEDDNDYYSE